MANPSPNDRLEVVDAVGSAVAGLHNISRLIFDARRFPKKLAVFPCFHAEKMVNKHVDKKQLKKMTLRTVSRSV